MNWNCPFCNHFQTVTGPKISIIKEVFKLSQNAEGPIGLRGKAISCSNPSCYKTQISVEILTARKNGYDFYFQDDGQVLFAMRLIPQSAAKPQPDYIPSALREDYLEACLIRDLSPKASATLTRRCLQGMIRDFCGVRERTLYLEVSALRALVENGKAPENVTIDSVDAIDNVRGVGNIGAHMEQDISHIVLVDPEEAQLLIELVESLFEEWYVAREKRVSRFSGIKVLADSKRKLISDLKMPTNTTDAIE